MQSSSSQPRLDLKAGLIPYASLVDRLGLSRPALDRLATDPTEGFPPRIRLGRNFWVAEAAVAQWVHHRTAMNFGDAP